MSKRSAQSILTSPKTQMRKYDAGAMSKEQRLALARAKQNRLVYAGLRPAMLPYAGQFQRANNREINYVDLASASYDGSTTGTITLIATIAQGASVNQRIGKRALYKSLLIRGHAVSGTATTVTDAAALVIYDKRPTGSLPAITDILTAVSSRAFMNDNNTGRFEVVRRYDFVFAGNSSTPTTGLEMQNFDSFVPLKRRPIVFESAGTGAIGDIDEGALYFVTVGATATGTACPVFTVAFRTRFTES